MKNKQIILFSGTTEGRILSSMLSKECIEHTVCVATEYGENVQLSENSEFAFVNSGRLDINQMAELADSDTKYFVDATHPYSDVVSMNIKKAAEEKKCEYIRVIRDVEEYDYDGVYSFENLEALIKALNNTDGNILITTGSKEINQITSFINNDERLYVRVIPSVESLELCKKAGIKNSHVIAMQGPFSVEMNAAIMSQYNIKYVVTRDSGKSGGYAEKIEAAKKVNAKCYVLEKPKEFGLSMSDAFKKLSYEFSDNARKSKNTYSLQACLIGCGPGSDDSMTIQSEKRINSADLVFGAPRLVENIKANNTYAYYLAKDIIPIIEDKKPHSIAVVFSGDTGFYSGAWKLEKSLKEWAEQNCIDLKIDIIPGISSVSYMASKIGKDYSDSELLSVHGRNSESQINDTVDKIAKGKSSYLLVSGGQDISEIYNRLCELKLEFSFIIGSRLSYDDEKIFEYDRSLLEDKGLYVCYVEIENPKQTLLIPYISDQEFFRNETPMTKEVIRHESIRRLNLKTGDVVYDIGSGTGSVVLEIAGLSKTLKVFSVERKSSAVEIQKENIGKMKAGNVVMVEGTAPEILDELPKPDAAFIGGSSGRLNDILDELSKKSSHVRVVINAISLETIAEISNLNKNEKIHNLEIETITVSKSKSVGDYNLMQGQNPVTIASFDLIG